MSNKDHLRKLLSVCDRYVMNPKYVYKLCADANIDLRNNKWLVVLEKLNNTITNESRLGNRTDEQLAEIDQNGMDKDCAIYRADKLLTIKIINIFDPKITKKYIVTKNHKNDYTTYWKNQIVKCRDFDTCFDNIFGSGIYYFKTIIPAYFDRDDPNTSELQYSGIWLEYDENGCKLSIREYYDGMKNGLYLFLHSNGNVKTDGFYTNDKKNGVWTTYDKSGRIVSEGEYIEDIKQGHWKLNTMIDSLNRNNAEYDNFFFDSNNNQKLDSMIEGKYVNDKKDGIWSSIHPKDDEFKSESKVIFKGEYTNGVRNGLFKISCTNRPKENVRFTMKYKSITDTDVKTNTQIKIDPDIKIKSNIEHIYYSCSKRVEGSFVNNLREGVWTFFSDETGFEEICIYNNGVIIKTLSSKYCQKNNNIPLGYSVYPLTSDIILGTIGKSIYTRTLRLNQ